MKLKPLTKERNKRAIIVNYAVAVIFISIGLYTKQSTWYVGGAILI